MCSIKKMINKHVNVLLSFLARPMAARSEQSPLWNLCLAGARPREIHLYPLQGELNVLKVN